MRLASAADGSQRREKLSHGRPADDMKNARLADRDRVNGGQVGNSTDEVRAG
jgi:hypothetical protein